MNIASRRIARVHPSTWLAAAATAYLSLSVTAPAADLLLEFKGGNGSTQADQFEGSAENGWGTLWQTANFSGEISASVEKENPLEAKGNYLAVTFTGGDGAITQGAVFRQYEGVQADTPHSFSFLIRGESALSGQDQSFNIFANPHSGRTGTDADFTWCVKASERGWQVCKGNGDGSGTWERTTVPYVVGQVYEIIVKVDPAQKSYEVAISDGSNTYESDLIHFRGDSAVDGTFLYFGAVATEPGQTLTFALDSVRVSDSKDASALR